MEEFMGRLKENDKVLVKAKIQNKTKKCYFLGTVNKSIFKKGGNPESLLHIKLDQDDGDKVRRIKLDGIEIDEVKKLIIPIDHLFKDKNIKPESIEGECGDDDKDCDGKLDEDEATMSNSDLDKAMNEGMEASNIDDDDFVDVKDEPMIAKTGGKKKKKKNRSRSKKNKKKRKRKNSTKKKN